MRYAAKDRVDFRFPAGNCWYFSFIGIRIRRGKIDLSKYHSQSKSFQIEFVL